MATYLDGGWYEPGKRSLRNAVIDAAMDLAGGLLRAGVPPTLVERVAVATRTQMAVLDPQLKGTRFGERGRELLWQRLMPLGDRVPEFASFLGDCIERVGSANELLAFYLHLVHVTRMMQLLSVAAPRKKVARLRKRPARRSSRR